MRCLLRALGVLLCGLALSLGVPVPVHLVQRIAAALVAKAPIQTSSLAEQFPQIQFEHAATPQRPVVASETTTCSGTN